MGGIQSIMDSTTLESFKRSKNLAMFNQKIHLRTDQIHSVDEYFNILNELIKNTYIDNDLEKYTIARDKQDAILSVIYDIIILLNTYSGYNPNTLTKDEYHKYIQYIKDRLKEIK